MAEDEVKKTGGQVDGKGLAHFISSFPAGGADATGLSQIRFQSKKKSPNYVNAS